MKSIVESVVKSNEGKDIQGLMETKNISPEVEMKAFDQLPKAIRQYIDGEMIVDWSPSMTLDALKRGYCSTSQMLYQLKAVNERLRPIVRLEYTLK